ncbi:MAG: hypothetical protein ABII75_07220 [Candidatus Omnitrophota bacterium]
MNGIESLKVKATGIGSMPQKNAGEICRVILDNFSDLPFWPQLPKSNAYENMLVQYSENLPGMIFDAKRKGVYFNTEVDPQKELLACYEKIAACEYEYFKISPEYAAGFYEMLKICRDSPCAFLKGQVVGPLTFLSSVQNAEGTILLYDDMFTDAITKALALKAVWQAKQIIAAGKKPVIFFDEPYLASFGSAFCNLSSERATQILNDLVGTVKKELDIPVGVHCCGNTDWTMLLNTDIDIVNFDFFGFGKYFMLYPELIRNFLNKGKIIAWGITPTGEYNSGVDVPLLREKFARALEILEKKNVARDQLLRYSIFTPACGMGTMSEEDSRMVIKITAGFARGGF